MQEFDNNIFVAQRGSWNRNRPIGARCAVLCLSLSAAAGSLWEEGQSQGPHCLKQHYLQCIMTMLGHCTATGCCQCGVST